MVSKSIGVLGCGYVGQQLLKQQQWHQTSWYSVHQHDAKLNYQSVPFSLDDANSWPAIPHQVDCLVMTIPPSYQDVTKERQRLQLWCQWMQVNRPQLQRLVYISTTGVYAEQAGIWTEQSPCQPSMLRGELRLNSENLLAEYFQTTAIRCGGIYGRGSNIVEKLKAGKMIYCGNKPMYRIHVDDLVGIMTTLVNNGNSHIRCLNAVDDQSVSQDEIITWLQQQPKLADLTLNFQAKRLDADANVAARVISNQALSTILGYQLKYSSYQAGLASLL